MKHTVVLGTAPAPNTTAQGSFVLRPTHSALERVTIYETRQVKKKNILIVEGEIKLQKKINK